VLSSVDLTPDIGSPNWSSIFSDPKLPLHIDVGCAKGRCIEKLSYRYSPRMIAHSLLIVLCLLPQK
jgi:tRNA G46 methylase TrmB